MFYFGLYKFEEESNYILMYFCFEKHFGAYLASIPFLIKDKAWTILN